MSTRRNALMFAGLLALPSCDAGDAAPVQRTIEPSAVAMSEAAPTDGETNKDAAVSRARAIERALRSQAGLGVDAGTMSLRVKTSDCEAFAGSLTECSGDIEIDVVSADGNIKQTLRTRSIYVDSGALVYLGPLDGSAKRDTYTFVISDVNGDEHDDLILWTGRDGAFGGPSFDIYLLDAKRRALVFSQSFSDLTVGYLGLFDIEAGKIRAASDEGCCWRVYDIYIVESNKPKLIERVTEATIEGGNVVVQRVVGDELEDLVRAPSVANGERSLRGSYGKCLDATDGGTWEMQACIEKEWNYQDARLNAAYRILKSQLSGAKREQLKKEQRQWLFDRDHGYECRWNASTEGQAQRIASNACRLGKVAVRAIELEGRIGGRAEKP